jgi:hypothetical protein
MLMQTGTIARAMAGDSTMLRVNSLSLSIDGYGAGPVQDLANPLGSGEALFPGLDATQLVIERAGCRAPATMHLAGHSNPT